EREAHRDKAESVGVEHLLHALAQEIRGHAGEILSSQGIGPGAFRPHVGALASATTESSKTPSGRQAAARGASGGDVIGGEAAGSVRDLVKESREGRFDPVIGRDNEVRRLLQILERRFKNHPLVIGEPGVGKTALIRALADRVARGDVPSNLAGARVLELDTGALVAGAKLRGEIEQRLKSLIDSLRSTGDGEVVLLVEDLDAIFGEGVQGAGVGELLKPLLGRSEIRIIATTTTEGLRKINERDPAVARRFTTITLEPPTNEQAM